MNKRELSHKLRCLSLHVAGCGFDAVVCGAEAQHRKLYRIADDLQRIARDLDAPPMDTCDWPDALEQAA